MSLKETLATHNRALVKREKIRLPSSGAEVLVCGLMMGDRLRVQEERTNFARAAVMISLCLEDPETGRKVYNPHSLEDREEIALWDLKDADTVAEICNRLSGITEEEREEMGKASDTSEPSSSSSPPDTVYLPAA